MPLKILLVSEEFPPETPGWGGIGSYVECIAPALARRGHEVHVLSCAMAHRTGDGLEDGVWVHRRRLPRIRGASRLRFGETAHRAWLGAFNYREARRLRTIFDVVEYPDWDAEGWMFAALGNVPTVAHLHTPLTLALRHKGVRESTDTRLAGRLERMSVSRATAVTSPSAVLAVEIAAMGWVERDAIQVIPYPIESQQWVTPPASGTGRIVQFAGRLDARKAPEVLIDAIAILRDEMPDVSARFAGEYDAAGSSGLPRLAWSSPRSFARSFDGCTFLGHVARGKLGELYASSRVFAQPSVFENFSFATLEAMAAGRAAVVTSGSGLAPFIADCGGGAVVAPRDPAALASALKPYLIDAAYAGEAGERARAAVRREFDPKRIALLREELYGAAIESFRMSRPHSSPAHAGVRPLP
ncbi:MAG: glycosyltransferase family 4 protein [Candidatus Binatus sp.]|uniref:glycosyltransferase family 4 protein n=1 Tax=Candidatus Binatus sp. TaxID=2811406 RepID=UPI00271CE316|nr:glycosyltransferase family 4 protein [Candidatus Binatus sp.]MDO8431275.1 glycosyltransferase family 4 protein [Candidatus Binatus sp.]